jgi:FkbM family methyltransferase
MVRRVGNLPYYADAGLRFCPRKLESDRAMYVVANLLPDELLVRTHRGIHLVVPSFNLDVAIGVIRDGVIEPWNDALLPRLLTRGSTYLNVGANFGYFTTLGAQLVGSEGKAIAIEANPYVFRYLIKSIYYAGVPNIVDAYQFAAAEENGKAEIAFDPQFMGGGNVFAVGTDIGKYADIEEALWKEDRMRRVLDKRHMFRPYGSYIKTEVPAVALDTWFPETKIDLLHIDAESFESHVILGCRQLLQRSTHARVLVEITPPHQLRAGFAEKYQQMLQLLCGELGMRIYKVNTSQIGKLDEVARENLPGMPHGDYLFTRQPV